MAELEKSYFGRVGVLDVEGFHYGLVLIDDCPQAFAEIYVILWEVHGIGNYFFAACLRQ
jgi:hypothetical protein